MAFCDDFRPELLPFFDLQQRMLVFIDTAATEVPLIAQPPELFRQRLLIDVLHKVGVDVLGPFSFATATTTLIAPAPEAPSKSYPTHRLPSKSVASNRN